MKAATSVVAATALALGVLVPVSQTITAEPAAAITGSDFDAGYIIADRLFYDGNAMSSADIQWFLESKVSGCDNANCLRNAVVNPPSYGISKSSSTGAVICNAVSGGSMRVSEWIYRVQVACGISAKVILVTLQKEQGLITKRAPDDGALRAAMGMACPDTAPCDSAYAGLATQIYFGTRQLMNYKAGRFGKLPGSNYIGYHPNASCGGTTVNIRNWATAALYTYTPYQPNAASLANLGGTGNSCSTYGNRNFWTYYANWFGDPRGGDPAWVDALYTDLLGRSPGDAAGSWQNQMLMNGWSRADLVSSIVQSAEYRQHEVTEVYLSVLGRAPDAEGLAYWSNQVSPAGPYLASQLPLLFLGTDELWIRGGSTAEGWSTLMYQYLLGRSPDSDGLAYWSNQARTAGRAAVMSGLHSSRESLERRVTYLFQTLLGHAPDPGGLAYYSNLAYRAADEGVMTELMASAEYAQRAQSRFTSDSGIVGLTELPPMAARTEYPSSARAFADALWTDVLGSTIDPATEASWVTQLVGGATRAGLATNLYQGAAYRTATITAAYQSAIGRAPESEGLAYWVGQATVPASQVVGELMASSEAYTSAGSTNAAWVAKVYSTLLGRSPDSDEAAYWAGQVASAGRLSVYARIYVTEESANRRAGRLVTAYLGRAATSTELTRYGGLLVTKSDEYVGALLAATSDYATRALDRYPAAVIAALGHDILGSAPDPATVTAWSQALASGTTLYRLASDTYYGTPYRTRVITSTYQEMLGRAPDSEGLAYWLAVTGPGGSMRVSQVRNQFLLSDEFYQSAGGTAQGWVSAMYQSVLGRPTEASGLAYWAAQVNQYGRASVLQGLYNSDENAQRRVNLLATALLGRAATSSELAHYAPLIKTYGDEFVAQGFIGTNDYVARADVLY